MIRISKGIAILWIIGIVIISIIIGMIIGCSITPGSIVMTKEKIVTEPCKHVNLNEVGVLEQSVVPHCDDCDIPAQRILYDPKNEITYIYTFYWKNNEGYYHNLYLADTDILKIQADGTSEMLRK